MKVIRKLLSRIELNKYVSNSAGLTLTELMVVIAIIGLVTTIVAQNIIGKFNEAKVNSTKIQTKQLGVILDQYRLDCGVYPTTDQGIEALIEAPKVGRACTNYDPEGYIKGGKIPKDGFGHPFVYTSDGNTYELKSLGNDKKEGGEKLDADISSKDIE